MIWREGAFEIELRTTVPAHTEILKAHGRRLDALENEREAREELAALLRADLAARKKSKP